MEKYVWIVRQKGDWKKGKVRLTDLRSVKWDRISGGARINAGMWGLYGYIYCNEIIEGEIGHSGIHGPCPHNIKIHIQECDNDKVIYDELVARAGEKPIDNYWGLDIADNVRKIVEKEPGITAVRVADILFQEAGIPIESVRKSIRYLKKTVFKEKRGLKAEKCGRTQKLYLKEVGEDAGKRSWEL